VYVPLVTVPVSVSAPQTDWLVYPRDCTVDGVWSPDETNSLTACPMVVWNEVLARIIIVGVVGDPISAVLLRGPISKPPKQNVSVQTALVCQLIRKSHPVPFCLTAKLIPETDSLMVGVSVQSEAVYAAFTLTAIVDL